MGLDLHGPVWGLQPHPGEKEKDNWLFKNGGKSMNGGRGYMSDVCMCVCVKGSSKPN